MKLIEHVTSSFNPIPSLHYLRTPQCNQIPFFCIQILANYCFFQFFYKCSEHKMNWFILLLASGTGHTNNSRVKFKNLLLAITKIMKQMSLA